MVLSPFAANTDLYDILEYLRILEDFAGFISVCC